jgi:hypothetical protein
MSVYFNACFINLKYWWVFKDKNKHRILQNQYPSTYPKNLKIHHCTIPFSACCEWQNPNEGFESQCALLPGSSLLTVFQKHCCEIGACCSSKVSCFHYIFLHVQVLSFLSGLNIYEYCEIVSVCMINLGLLILETSTCWYVY